LQETSLVGVGREGFAVGVGVGVGEAVGTGVVVGVGIGLVVGAKVGVGVGVGSTTGALTFIITISLVWESSIARKCDPPLADGMVTVVEKAPEVLAVVVPMT
jgi:hypothetical protein